MMDYEVFLRHAAEVKPSPRQLSPATPKLPANRKRMGRAAPILSACLKGRMCDTWFSVRISRTASGWKAFCWRGKMPGRKWGKNRYKDRIDLLPYPTPVTIMKLNFRDVFIRLQVNRIFAQESLK